MSIRRFEKLLRGHALVIRGRLLLLAGRIIRIVLVLIDPMECSSGYTRTITIVVSSILGLLLTTLISYLIGILLFLQCFGMQVSTEVILLACFLGAAFSKAIDLIQKRKAPFVKSDQDA
jgi:hypothetical protein